MTILYNDQIFELPNLNMNLAEFAELKNVPHQGAAIAVNDKLIPRDKWKVTMLNPMDRVTVITAAYGG